jgi:hypothetical protein
MRFTTLSMLITALIFLGMQTAVASRSLFRSESRNLAINTCISNAFLNIRKNLATPLVTLTTPRKTIKVCSFEWNTYGTCCDENQIMNHVNADHVRINKAVNIVLSQYRSLKLIHSTLYDNLARLAVSPVSPTNAKLNSARTAANNYLRVPRNQKFFYKFFNMGDDLMSNDFNSTTHKCWTEMKETRDASLCYTCSPRSRIFFNGNMALAVANKCVRLMDKCFRSFKYILDLIKVLNWFREFDDLFLTQHGITVNTVSKFYQIKLKQYNNEISRHEITEKMYQMDDYMEEGVWQQYSPQVCQKFVHAARKTLIEDLAGVMKEYNVRWIDGFKIPNDYKIHIDQNAAYIKQRIDAYLKELEAIRKKYWENEKITSSRSTSLSRALFTGSDSDVFSTDTEFVQPQSQKDLTSNFFIVLPDLSQKMPMNLEITFP